MTIAEILKNSSEILRDGGIAEPRREAKSLLAFALNVNQIFLVAHDDYELSEAEKIRFADFIKRRAEREPLQYIVGKQEFYALDFAVTPDVLIPRPETEIIVETAVEFLQNRENSSFCEVGIGSGCIAVSILHSNPAARAIGLDVSERALEIARKNAATHRVADRLELKSSDVFDSLKNHSFDLIVSNPPYIPQSDVGNLQPEVRDYEPPSALTDGGDGLSIIKKLIEDAPLFLKSNGLLLIEIGISQAATVERFFDRSKWSEIEILTDLQNIPRTVKAVKK